ncbi:hypothetical protein PCE1_001271 [Barthelona sp. PCE]
MAEGLFNLQFDTVASCLTYIFDELEILFDNSDVILTKSGRLARTSRAARRILGLNLISEPTKEEEQCYSEIDVYVQQIEALSHPIVHMKLPKRRNGLVLRCFVENTTPFIYKMIETNFKTSLRQLLDVIELHFNAPFRYIERLTMTQGVGKVFASIGDFTILIHGNSRLRVELARYSTDPVCSKTPQLIPLFSS